MGRDGRVFNEAVLDTSEAGGFVQLQASQTTYKRQQKLMRIRMADPGMTVFEISSVLKNTDSNNGLVSRVVADVSWQIGRGTQSATVEVNKGMVFTVAAADVVDVTARLEIPSLAGSTSNTTLFEVSGTCAPCAAMAPIPAYYTTSEIEDDPGAYVFDEIPTWARTVRFFCNGPAISAFQCRPIAGGVAFLDFYAAIGAQIPIHWGTTGMLINVPAGLSVSEFYAVWELYL